MSADGLRPCPFCGRAPRWMATAGPQPWYWVHCVCGIALSVQMTPEAAITAWNTRAWSPPPSPSWPRPPAARCFYVHDATGPRPARGVVIPHGPAAAVLCAITCEWLTTSAIAASVGLSVSMTYSALNGIAHAGVITRQFWCDHAALDGHYGCSACFADPLRHEWHR